MRKEERIKRVAFLKICSKETALGYIRDTLKYGTVEIIYKILKLTVLSGRLERRRD